MYILKILEFARKYHKPLFLISLLLLFFLDIWVISQRPLTLSSDSSWWLIIQKVEAGQGYKACDPAYIPNCAITDQTTAMREPLPVLFFALVGRLTGNSPFAYQFSQLVFNLLICFFIYLFVRELGNRTLALVASYAWVFYLYGVHTVMNINGDLMAGVFVISGLVCSTRALRKGTIKDWILCGLLFGLAVLSRSSTLLIFLVLLAEAAFYLWRSGNFQQKWYHLVPVVVAFGLVVSPWVIRNEIVFGKPILGTTLVGYNLYRHNAILSSNVFPHYVGASEGYREVKDLVARTPQLRHPINEARVDEIFQQAGLKIILAHPLKYVELSIFRILPLWFDYGVLDQYGERMMFVDELIVIQQAFLLVLFLIGVWKGNWYVRFLAVCVLLFALAYMAIDSQLRYMIPVMPLVIVISVAGIDCYIRGVLAKKLPYRFGFKGNRLCS